MFEQKIDHQPKFLDSCYKVLSICFYFFFKKKQLDASETVKCLNETNIVQLLKFFYL